VAVNLFRRTAKFLRALGYHLPDIWGHGRRERLNPHPVSMNSRSVPDWCCTQRTAATIHFCRVYQAGCKTTNRAQDDEMNNDDDSDMPQHAGFAG